MATVTKERTASATALRAARETRNAADAIHDAARSAVGKARHATQFGEDYTEKIRAQRDWDDLLVREDDARQALERAEAELKAAIEAAAVESHFQHFPAACADARKLDDLLAQVVSVTERLEERHNAARRDGAYGATNSDLLSIGGQVRAQLSMWRHRNRKWLEE